MSHGKNFTLTLNNYTAEEYIAFTDWAREKCGYFIIGEEVGESGNPHLQIYIQCLKDTRYTSIKKMCPRAHIESARGDWEDNHAYICEGMKDGQRKKGTIDPDPLIWGTPTHRGQRKDLEALANEIVEGKHVNDVALDNPGQYVRYFRGLHALADIVNKPKLRDNIKVIWLFGKKGTGKTSFAFENFENPYIKDGTQWWPGYDDTHDVIVIDDFDGHWPFRDLLRLLDRYPYRGQTKGGYVNINCETFIITCDRPPRQALPDLSNHEWEQLERRLNFVLEVVRDVEGNTRYLNIRDNKNEIEIE